MPKDDNWRCVDPWGRILEHYDGDWHVVGEVERAISDDHHDSTRPTDTDPIVAESP